MAEPAPDVRERARVDVLGKRVALVGTLDAAAAVALWPRLDAATAPRRRGGGRAQDWTVVDCSKARVAGSAAVALLAALEERGLALEGLDPSAAAGVAEIRRALSAKPAGAEKGPGLFARIGRRAAEGAASAAAGLAFLGRSLVFCVRGALHPRRHPVRGFAEIFARVGADAVPVAMAVGFLLGVILAFESAVPLRMFGAEIYVGDLIGIATVRELCVLVAAVVMAARTASAYAAELGTMVVGDEIAALRTMGLDPVDRLAVPRILAAGAALPVLAVFAGVASLSGGFATLALFGYSLPVFWDHAMSFCKAGDVVAVLFKGAAIGLLIGGVGCRAGLETGGDPDAVGRSTTRAVVGAIVAFALADGFFAVVYHVLGI